MESSTDFGKIAVEELRHWMEVGRDFVLVDTLPGEVFAKRHIPGAGNACVFQVVFPSLVEALVRQREKEIVVYGSSSASHDAVTAAQKLSRLGYRKVFVLSGGLEAWQEAGFPLEGKDTAWTGEIRGLKLDERVYAVDPVRSLIEWTGRNHNTRHYGSLGISKGQIEVRDGKISGSFEIDMRSIKNVNLEGDELQPVLISHLQSDDFFFVEKFPTASFTIKSARVVDESAMGSPNMEIEGALKLRGTAGDVTFPATVNILDDGAASVEAHFDIDRTRWNVIYGSARFFEHLGMHLVFDLISVQVRIVAR